MAEAAPADEVEVEVVDGHAGVVADVEGEAVAGLVHAFGAAHFVGERKESGERLRMASPDFTGVGDVLAGDDEGVDGGARVANAWSFSAIRSTGMSPEAMLQKRQSATGRF